MWRRRKTPVDDSQRVVTDRERARELTMNRAIELLAAKPRSVDELRERLLERSWTNAEIVDSVIARLKEYKYLDDEQYARDLALSKLRQKPQGRHRLRQSMSGKKLDGEAIDAALTEAFEELPESALIDAAIEKRLRLKGRPETRDEIKKFYDYLLRQGFGYDLIRQKLAAVVKAND